MSVKNLCCRRKRRRDFLFVRRGIKPDCNHLLRTAYIAACGGVVVQFELKKSRDFYISKYALFNRRKNTLYGLSNGSSDEK